MMPSNNSDTTRYIYITVSPVSLKNGCAYIVQNENEVKIFFTFCKRISLLNVHMQTNMAETFIKPYYGIIVNI